ncbi:MAG: OmpA family protein [Coriobacteriia bacterium]|nr:OmpA family protein [Coriobacteriia bacterium]
MKCTRTFSPTRLVPGALGMLVVAALVLPAQALAVDIHVATSGGDYTDVQAAVDAASPGDRVMVAAGTFAGQVRMKDGVSLIGAGADVTTLTADGSDGATPTVYASAISSATTISGFTLTHSAGDGSGMVALNGSDLTISACTMTGNTAVDGAGLFAENSKPTITDCTFTGNTSYNDGAGVYFWSADGVMTDSVVTSNRANDDGAIYIHDCSPTISDSTITTNTAGYRAGGIFADNSDAQVSECDVSGNHSDEYGGGLCFAERAHPDFVDCTIDGNESLYGRGGGMYCGESVSPTFLRCTISNSRADNDGGGISAYDCDATFTDCVISNNSTTADGGAVGSDEYADLFFIGCDFFDNSAGDDGGGAWAEDDGDAHATNCVFVGNTAAGDGGAAALDWDAYLRLVNCTIYGNDAGNSGDGVYCDEASAYIFNCIVWGNGENLHNCSASYSDVEGGGGYDGNIDAAPSFVDTEAANFHLNADSPCIGVGTPIDAPLTDKDGYARGDAVDMGAYEYRTHTLSPAAGIGGTISPSEVQTVVAGTSKTFQIEAANGYHLVATKIDGESIGTSYTVDFSVVTTDHVLAAMFVRDSYDTVGSVHFAMNSTKLRPGARRALRAWAHRIAAKDLLHVRVGGYTSNDPDGGSTIKSRKKLSSARAAAVRAYLITQLRDHGSKASVTTYGYGGANPVASNRTAKGRLKNRRAVVWAR